MKSKHVIWVFVVVSIANLISQFILSDQLNLYTKPLLIPLLVWYVYLSSIGKVTGRILLLAAALILSWLGDVSLMFQGETIYFMIGIGFFLLAQVTYIIVLFRSCDSPPTFNAIGVLPFVVYAVGLFRLLLPNAGDFMIPIMVYGVVIAIMAAMAHLRKGYTSQPSYQLAFFGSLLFVLSDTVLAINKFYAEIPLSGVWIMATYIGAQYLLTIGLLRHSD